MRRISPFKYGSSLLLSLLVFTGSAWAADYTEEQYVNEVMAGSKDLQATQQDIRASRIDEGQVDLQLSPILNASTAINQDRRQQQFSSPSYESANTVMADASVSQQTSQGTRYKVGVEGRQMHLKGINLGPNAPRMDADLATLSPSIEVSQSLWQNAWGRSIELQRSALTSATRIQERQLEAMQAGKRLEARLAYGRVVFARERVQNAEESLANAEKILKYVKDKANRNLAETSDLLQSQALTASRELELRQAQAELDEAHVFFNSLRQRSGPAPEKLQSLKAITTPVKTQSLDVNNRVELAIYEAQLKATTSSIELEKENARSTFEVFASYSALSTREEIMDTPSGFGSPYQPNTTIGLRLSMPLDQGLVNRQLQASSVRKTATELRREDERIKLQAELSSLLVKRKDSMATLAVAEKLETLQRKKLDNEQKEYRNGRSTTYQILMFTQDLANAEFAKLQILYSLKIIDSQIRMYERNAA
ncbi:MAG TPA: TolC family protein [Oligoflexus sp.]|uniref:TolC family protein n=1 Tax=Oligoflexus sp. TaxID=1971216 RepID=UPI002D4B09DB|nr:TolC family protein [Oligoflexus sp.]HYX38705.1 TolC family protein [Oligoflexus sp.]